MSDKHIVPLWLEPVGSLRQAMDTISRYLRDSRALLPSYPGKKLKPNAIYLTYKSVSSAALNATVRPGILNPWVRHLEDHVTYQGQFTKPMVAYIDFNPPPLFWDYKCAKCRWFQSPKRCKMVVGDISRDGWCAIWLPPYNSKPGQWPKELVRGDW